ncbi:MAG: ABC transporter ATP-binding protein [Oscillospiraceae bacterium]|nr:ABC transporter ATP-binding protein [Oscillospiraceae bacterium]
MDLLRMEHLTKIYGKGENEVRALDDVSFSVPKGQMTAIIGPSGSGKSTLLHIIGAVDRPTSGKVFLNDQDVFAQKDEQLAIFRRREVGLIYQFYNLIPVLTAEENMTLPMIMDGKKPQKQDVEKMLDQMGLLQRRNHLPSQLSGGQQQRVSIARALFNMPSVILADEPTGNLDSKNSREIMSLLRKLNHDFNQTMLIITHDENIALLCDRVIAIEDGRILRDELTGRTGRPQTKADKEAQTDGI